MCFYHKVVIPILKLMPYVLYPSVWSASEALVVWLMIMTIRENHGTPSETTELQGCVRVCLFFKEKEAKANILWALPIMTQAHISTSSGYRTKLWEPWMVISFHLWTPGAGVRMHILGPEPRTPGGGQESVLTSVLNHILICSLCQNHWLRARLVSLMACGLVLLIWPNWSLLATR